MPTRHLLSLYQICIILSTINAALHYTLFYYQEPNPEDPLNKEAAEVLQTNRRLFEHNVAKAMRGNYIGGTYFECCLK